MIYRLLDRLFQKKRASNEEQIPGIYIGAYRDPKTGEVEWLYDTTDRHVLLAAPTRAGKGVSFAIPNLLAYPESMVVTDIKGEHFVLTSGYRRERLGNIILRFDPTCTDGSAARFNPLAEVRLRTEHEIEDAANIATFIVDPDGTAMVGEHGHWARTARSFLTGAILHVLYCCEEATLAGLDAFLSDAHLTQEEIFESMLSGQHDPQFTRGWLDENNEPTATMKEIAMAARDMIERPPGECGSILSAVKSRLDIYRDPIIAKNTACSDFSIADLMQNDRPVTLYITSTPADMERVRPLTRLLFHFIMRTAMPEIRTDGEQRAQAKYKHPLFLLADEFPTFGKLPILTESLPWFAWYGIRAALIIQDISQLIERYGEAGARAIMANMHIKILYAPGDPKTAKEFSDLLGPMTLRYNSKSSDARGKPSWSERLERRPLLTPDEFMALDARAGVVVLNRERPIACEHIIYYEEPLFTSRLYPACAQSDRIPLAQQAGRQADALLRHHAETAAQLRLAHAVPLTMEERTARELRRTELRARIHARKAARSTEKSGPRNPAI